jgi:thiamine monophosphate synthase
LNQFKALPVIVIGGVEPEDFSEILKTGAWGAALASFVNLAEAKRSQAEQAVLTMRSLAASYEEV